MVYIYKDQTACRIILETSIDFNLIVPDTCSIGYEKPDGVKNSWDAEILTGSESDGKIFLDFSAAVKFDVVGKWKLWAEISFADDRVAYGSVYHYYVHEKGQTHIN